MKRRKQISRSFSALSAAGRAVLSITENTVAPLTERLGKKRQRQVMSSDEIARRLAQDEQEMFDAQMASLPTDRSSGHEPSALEAQRRERTEDDGRTPQKLVAVLNGVAGTVAKRGDADKEAAGRRGF
ncbi:MAG: hypothetical protein ACM3SX_12785 [Deltaproteobacteria bacterium]